MAIFVPAGWVEEGLDSPSVFLLDPRRPMRYLQGHLKNAVNVSTSKLFDADGKLLPDDALAALLGAAGLDSSATPVVYDSYDGQNAAMLAWILEYLGRDDVHVLNEFFEHWTAAGREVFYKPVQRPAAHFLARKNPSLRIMAAEIGAAPELRLIDFRSRDEYAGTASSGHIPGAVNLVWSALVDRQGPFFDAERIERALREAGVPSDKRVVAYCRMGPRAALGFLLLRQAGFNACLYDGSYADWTGRDLPSETC